MHNKRRSKWGYSFYEVDISVFLKKTDLCLPWCLERLQVLEVTRERTKKETRLYQTNCKYVG